MKEPRFEIFIDVAGQYRWRLRAKNNEIVANSESYKAKQSAINSAYRVQEIANEAKVYDHTEED